MRNELAIPEDDLDGDLPPQCRAAVDAIQRTLDGAPEPPGLVAHALSCAACRERVRAARVLLSVLSAPAEPVAVPAGFADRVLASRQAERRAPTRGRAHRAAAWLALAAAVLVGVWSLAGLTPTEEVVAVVPRVAPAPEPAPEPAPAPRPIHVGDAIASTGQAIRDVPNPLADSVAAAPRLFDALADSFKMPEPADPMAHALEPARRSLDSLPVAARSGLEPVTGTAEKAFNRFLRDVGSVKPNS